MVKALLQEVAVVKVVQALFPPSPTNPTTPCSFQARCGTFAGVKTENPFGLRWNLPVSPGNPGETGVDHLGEDGRFTKVLNARKTEAKGGTFGPEGWMAAAPWSWKEEQLE